MIFNVGQQTGLRASETYLKWFVFAGNSLYLRNDGIIRKGAADIVLDRGKPILAIKADISQQLKDCTPSGWFNTFEEASVAVDLYKKLNPEIEVDLRKEKQNEEK